ncbi:hypothetical protein J7M22_04670 [Candidatus Poribacteria bacterium]|nr:hypothetical protein [Candidatus Poribacteria bacterium]
MSKALERLRSDKGQALIEYTILMGLLGLAMVVAIANVADQIMDIWNDLTQDLDTIDDGVSDSDLTFPVSNADGSNKDGGANHGGIGQGSNDNDAGGYRDEL